MIKDTALALLTLFVMGACFYTVATGPALTQQEDAYRKKAEVIFNGNPEMRKIWTQKK